MTRDAANPRILIAGIGNIFLGDDAFGVEVVRKMTNRPLPDGVRVVEFGIRGIDLTYALLDGWDVAILVDAVPRGGGNPPGTLYLIEPDVPDPIAAHSGGAALEGHNMDPIKVLNMAAAMGGQVRRVLVVGCEPTPLDEYADMQIGLSPPVEAAVDEAVSMIESLIERIRSGVVDVPVQTASPA